MRVGLFTDALAERPLADALGWIAAELPDVRDVEIATGGFSAAPHCDREQVLADSAERADWLETIHTAGFGLAALNVSGNPLQEREHENALRQTLRLAPLLGVDRVVCMSGGDARLSGAGWFPGLEAETERHWSEHVLPLWRSLLADTPSGLRLCLELEPGNAAFNVSTFERLAALDERIALNLDPSHFLWQSIDPLEVVARLGDRIAFVHGKDTALDPARVALDGVLQRDGSWHYAAVGRGHGLAWWSAFLAGLAEAGYDSVVSIEVEDPHLPPEHAIRESADVLTRALEPAITASSRA